VDVETAIRTRRTHKAFEPQPVERATLLELFELARWAPNHRLTNPWRFRVLGERTRADLARESERASAGSARKRDPGEQREDLLAAGVAAYLVLLGAHARGLAGYWRTLAILDTPAVRAALAIEDDELPIGLLHLGRPHEAQRVPEREGVEAIAVFLD
jgi:nitroreductase